MAYTFKGGVRLQGFKLTSKSESRDIPSPPQVKISLNGGGFTADPTVAVGERVKIGDVIGESPRGTLGCPVHASISGVVTAVESTTLEDGSHSVVVTIDSDGCDEVSPAISPCQSSITELSPEEITDVIRRAGIVGMGGEGFSTSSKINSAMGKVEHLIVNCVECEPFATADHRIILESPDRVIGGIKILMRAVSAPSAYIAIEDQHDEAVRLMTRRTRKLDFMSVRVVKAKYPQGDERQLIYALTERELAPGKIPADAGCVVFNVSTCAAVYDAFATGMPLTKRIVTVSGDCVKSPSNLRVPVGTPVSYLIEQCGGITKAPEKMILGGPMMGQTINDPATATEKTTASLLLLSGGFSPKTYSTATCIRCGKCLSNCPLHLTPAYIASFAAVGDYKNAERFGALSCMECGCCAYACPGKVELVELIRQAKAAICTAKDTPNKD